jgi:hypothetical protein
MSSGNYRKENIPSVALFPRLQILRAGIKLNHRYNLFQKPIPFKLLIRH